MSEQRLLENMVRLARALHAKHFESFSPYWEPLQSCQDVLLQIDNMTAGMSQRIATLEREIDELKSQTLKRLMQEYDEMSEDGAWEGDHPIAQMAEHIDTLRAELRQRVES